MRTLATPVGARPPKKKEDPVRGTEAGLLPVGLQRMAERCAIEMCTQDTPAPTVRDAIVALDDVSNIFAGLKMRGEETDE